MHTGNLVFVPAAGRLQLAPAYDMLPMRFAPLPGGELPTRSVELALPVPDQRARERGRARPVRRRVVPYRGLRTHSE